MENQCETSLTNVFVQNLQNKNFPSVKWKGFTNASKKVKVTAGGRSKEITAQRDILGPLARKSQQYDAAINTDKALSFPLAPVPLTMATYDSKKERAQVILISLLLLLGMFRFSLIMVMGRTGSF